MKNFVISCLFVHEIITVAQGLLYCYVCSSAMSGCGDPIDVRMIHWRRCSGRRVTEDYCVKVVEHVGEQSIVTRGCLSDLLLNTQYRFDMPWLRRQGYCVNSRTYQKYRMDQLTGRNLTDFAMGIYGDESQDFKRYCFCNDFMACNSSNIKRFTSSVLIICFLLFIFTANLII